MYASASRQQNKYNKLRYHRSAKGGAHSRRNVEKVEVHKHTQRIKTDRCPSGWGGAVVINIYIYIRWYNPLSPVWINRSALRNALFRSDLSKHNTSLPFFDGPPQYKGDSKAARSTRGVLKCPLFPPQKLAWLRLAVRAWAETRTQSGRKTVTCPNLTTPRTMTHTHTRDQIILQILIKCRRFETVGELFNGSAQADCDCSERGLQFCHPRYIEFNCCETDLSTP